MIDTEEAIEAADKEFKRIESLLFDGTEEQFKQLAGWRCPRCGEPFEYEYTPKWDGLSYGCMCTQVRAHGTHYEPACITYFGNRHTF